MSGKAKGAAPDPVPAVADLREAIREAHGVIKDMRTERRAIEALLDGIPARVDARIEHQLVADLEVLGRRTKQAMDASVARVNREFDRLADILMGRDPESRAAGRAPLDELIPRAVQAGAIPLRDADIPEVSP